MLVAMHHLMGAAEIGERLGLSRQRIQQLLARDDFPKPDSELRMGKVWKTADVEAWIREHRTDVAERPEEAPAPGVRKGRKRTPRAKT